MHAAAGRGRDLDAAARGDAGARLPRRARRDDPRQGRLPLGRPLLPDPARARARAARRARYVRDFLPFIALVLLYEEARGLAHSLHPQPVLRADAHARPLDRLRRGADDAAQDWLWHGHLEWYDHALSLLDRLHFIVPPTLLLLIWLERRDVFYRCAATLVAVSFAGAATFLAFPAAPPWLASKHGLIPHVARIGYVEGGSSPVSTSKSWIESHLLANPVAAVPSLHAAYALLVLLFACAWRGRSGLWALSLHARHVVHGRLPRRPLRRRPRGRRGLRDRRLAARPAAASAPARCAACSGPFPPPLARRRRGDTAMFYARAHDDDVRDLIIIGGACAGLTAAVYASRANLRPLCIEGFEAGGQLMITSDVENYPGFPEGVLGPDLMVRFREQAERFGTEFITDDVTSRRLQRAALPGLRRRAGAPRARRDRRHRRLRPPARPAERAGPAGARRELLRHLRRGLLPRQEGARRRRRRLRARGGDLPHQVRQGRRARAPPRRAARLEDHAGLRPRQAQPLGARRRTWSTRCSAPRTAASPAPRLRNADTGEERIEESDGFFVAIGHTPNTELFRGILDMDENGYLIVEPGTTRTNDRGRLRGRRRRRPRLPPGHHRGGHRAARRRSTPSAGSRTATAERRSNTGSTAAADA